VCLAQQVRTKGGLQVRLWRAVVLLILCMLSGFHLNNTKLGFRLQTDRYMFQTAAALVTDDQLTDDNFVYTQCWKSIKLVLVET